MTDRLTLDRRSRVQAIAAGLSGGLIVFVALEALTRAGLFSPTYLPPASNVLLTTGQILVDPDFLTNVAGTLTAWLIGMLIAILIAVPFGLLLGSSRRSHLAATTTIELLRPIPSVALIPLAIIIMGRGLDMRVALIVFASIWPILFNTVYGIRDVDPLAKETARVYGLTRGDVLLRVSLPWASPFIFTGIRISTAIALILAISSELIAGGGPGLGTWMLSKSQTGVPREYLYAGIVVAGLLGLLINIVMGMIERRLFAWHQRVRVAA